jgi:hypothetical protein
MQRGGAGLQQGGRQGSQKHNAQTERQTQGEAAGGDYENGIEDSRRTAYGVTGQTAVPGHPQNGHREDVKKQGEGMHQESPLKPAPGAARFRRVFGASFPIHKSSQTGSHNQHKSFDHSDTSFLIKVLEISYILPDNISIG